MRGIYNVACELLDRHVRSRGDKIALYYLDQRISYARLQEQVNRFGNLLQELEVSPGERVLIALPDCPECVYAFLGSMKHGAWPVLVSPLLSASTYTFLLNDSQASVVVTTNGSQVSQVRTAYLRHLLCIDDQGFMARAAAASPELDPYPSRKDDIAFLLYSSGSTGNPKGVPHRHGDMPFTAEVYGRQVLQVSAEDICFSASKLFFAYGLGNSISFPLSAGAGVVLNPDKSTALEVFKIISCYRPSLFFGVPTLYNLMLKTLNETLSLDSLRLCASAGEALPAATYHSWKELTDLEIIDGIGSTEALHIFISNRPGKVRPGTSGYLVPPYEARIVGSDGLPGPSGEPGHLLIRGKSTAPFYWNRPDKTAETMLADGWLRTGDIYLEEGGCYSFQGRADDMFKVDARWVSPITVEEVLRVHPAVLECAVTWRKLEGLVVPRAHVVLSPGFQEGMQLYRELRAHVLQRLPEYMCPVEIVFCAELPKTDTGKIQRFRLRIGEK
ncbi:MAG: benzoate-CoA ligase family protein [Desulfobaccales bacterium]